MIPKCTHPTPPSPTNAVRAAGLEHLSQISSSMWPRSTKSGSRRKGVVEVGSGGVSGRATVPQLTSHLQNDYKT